MGAVRRVAGKVASKSEEALGAYLDEYGTQGHRTKCRIYSVRTSVLGLRTFVAVFTFILKTGWSVLRNTKFFDFTALMIDNPTTSDWIGLILTILFILSMVSAISQVITIIYRRWYFDKYCRKEIVES